MAENTPSGRGYGQRQEFDQNAEAIAGMGAASPHAGTPTPKQMAGLQNAPTDAINAPTTRPNEPVTAGLDTGPGANSASLPQLNKPAQTSPNAHAMTKYMPALELLASLPTSTPATRQFVRQLRSQQPPAAQLNRPDYNTPEGQ